MVSVLRGFWPQDQTGAASPPSHSLNVGNSSDPDPGVYVISIVKEYVGSSDMQIL